MGAACCSSRDASENLDPATGEPYALPGEKRAQFKSELVRAIDKEYLHNEVLSQ
jgi:hypothetical protein